jgi:hypothetical protein
MRDLLAALSRLKPGGVRPRALTPSATPSLDAERAARSGKVGQPEGTGRGVQVQAADHQQAS